MAKVYLDPGDEYRIVNDNVTVYGSSDDEQIIVESGADNVVADANVERVDFAGNVSDFTFKQAGNQLLVYDSEGNEVAQVGVQEDGTELAFTNGLVELTLDPDTHAMLLGGAEVSADEAAAVEPTQIDDSQTSEAGTGGGTGGGGTGGETGKTFVLTNSNNQTTGGVDNIVGTDGDDWIIGSATGAGTDTYQTGDLIDGRGGYDTFQLLTATNIVPSSIKNVEDIKMQATGATILQAASIDASADGTTFESYYSTNDITVENVKSTTGFDFKLTNTQQGMFVQFDPAAVSGTDDNVNLTVENAGIKANPAAFTVDGAETLTINSTGSAKNYVDIASGSDNNAGYATTDNPILKTVKVTGDQAIKLGDFVATASATNGVFVNTVTTVDASANTGGVEFSIKDNGNLDIKGSSANDKVTITNAGNLNSQDSIDLGDGDNDMLIVNATPGNGADIKNVEALGIKAASATGAGTIDASKVSGIDKVTVLEYANDTGGALQDLTIDNAPTNVEVDYVNYSNAVLTDGQHGAITIKPAVANKDYTLTINNNPESGKTDGVDLVTKGGVTLNNAKTITINSIGGNNKLNADTADIVNGTKYNQVTLTTTTNTVKITGDTNLKFNTNSTTVKTIDASDFTGGVQIDTTGMASAINATVTTGSGNDLINLNDAADKYQTINTGAGDDWILIDEATLTKKDTIDGGEGTDTLVIKDTAAGNQTVNWNGATFTKLDGVSNIEQIGLDNSKGGSITLNLADTAVSKLGNDVKIVSYSITSNNNYTIDNSGINSTTAKVTVDLSNVTGTGALTYTAGKNIDVVKGTDNNDTINIKDTNLGTDDSFDAGKGTDILALTLTGSGDSTDYSVLSADKLTGIKSFETLTLDVATGNYAKLVIDNDFALNNQVTNTNILTLQAPAAGLTKDYLTVDASGVQDVQLKVDGTNFGAKHIDITTGSADDTFTVTGAGTITIDHTTINFGDGTDVISVQGTASATINLEGSTFSNYEKIVIDTSAADTTLKMDADDISGKNVKVIENAGGAANTATLYIDGASTGASSNDSIDLTKIDTNSTVDNIIIHGNDGNDSITLSGVDFSTAPTIQIFGDEGSDAITGSANADIIDGGNGDDKITGGAGDDTIDGGAGADTIDGGAGADTIDGGAGNDTIIADDTDTIDGGAGTDTVRFAAAVSTANLKDADLNNVENVVITNTGNATYDFSVQTEGLKITGNTGNDTIICGNAPDTITGGAGADTITTGGGNDKVVLDHFATADNITDFTSGADDIYIDILNNNTKLTGASANKIGSANTLGKNLMVTKNKMFVISHTTAGGGKNGGITSVLVNKNINTVGKNLSATLLFSGSKLTALKSAITKTVNLTFTRSEKASGVAFGFTTVNHKLYMIAISDTNGIGSSGTNGQKIVSVKQIATLAVNPGAGDIHIF